MAIPPPVDSKLNNSLKPRHLTMLSLGGVVGAGLFIGSGTVISSIGPGAFITYGLTGILVLLVMRMLGEMAVARPTGGSFMTYARQAMGNWAGFTTGWLYWYFWVIIVGFEAVVGGQLIQAWLPEVPLWIISSLLLAVMTGVNLLNVKSFGEAEYWFASIKVASIIVFLVLTAAFILHLWPGGSGADIGNLVSHDGFAPFGVGSILTGVAVVIFAMTGAEVVTIAAAESENPAKNIRKAINSIVFRLLCFYVASTLFIVIIVPWDEVIPGESPFVTALDRMGLPGAGQILNIVILTAVLSILNTGLYTSSRLLLGLAQSSDAPRWIGKINSKGVPVGGVLACTAAGFAFIFLSVLWPDTIVAFLINSSGAVFLFIYLMICLSQLLLRRKLEREAEGKLEFKIWFYPVLPILVTLSIVVILASMAFSDSTRSSLIQSLIALGIIVGFYLIRRLRMPDAARRGEAGSALSNNEEAVTSVGNNEMSDGQKL